MYQRLIDKQVLYTGKKLRLEVHHLQDETTDRRLTREVVVHNGAVVILPLLGDGRVVLIRNQRYSVGQTLIELPAGTLEKGEDPINCAGRELLEETGYLAGRLEALCSFFSSPGILTEKMYVYAAYDLEKQAAALEEGEEIELAEMTLDQAIALIAEGRIVDGKTIAALLFYERFRR